MRSSLIKITAIHFLSLVQAQESKVHLLGQLGPGTFLENLAPRSNGQILMTELTAPRLWSFDSKGIAAPFAVHEFSAYTSLSGITETNEDVFAVVMGNLTNFIPSGNNAVWRVDFTHPQTSNHKLPTISKITDIPQGIVLNGMTYIPTAKVLLIADSILGVIFSIDPDTGTITTAISDPLMKACPSTNPGIGINGLRYHPRSSTLYWTNTGCGTLNRIRINPGDGSPSGRSELVGSTGQGLDDFALAEDGTAYIANNKGNSIIRMRPNGVWSVVAGNLNGSDTGIVGPTSTQFVRSWNRHGCRPLYVSATGGSLGAVDGGAQLLVVDVEK